MPKPQELRELALEEIEPNRSQPRQYFDEAALDALAGSIGRRGVLQPVLVRSLKDGKYEMIVGERRWRAAMIAGLQSIPALVCPFDDEAALEAALIENMAREDLNPVEEARACATLVKEFGLTVEMVGQRVGRSRVAMSNLMRLLGLSPEILELMERGQLSEGHGRALLTAKDHRSHGELARRAIEEGWSVRVLEDWARQSNGIDSVPDSPGSVSKDAAPDPGEGEGDRDPDTLAMNVARVWGDLLGVEVGVRTVSGRKFRVEADFTSAEVALAVGGNLTEAVARGSKRR
jgi:ParB family transcriptional regulator, chromosome partitioning protein